MSSIKKITTRYSQTEDRFSLYAQADDGTIISLWLSQRMLLRLIPRMLGWLEIQKNTSLQNDARATDTINEFAQQEAHYSLEYEEPVQSLIKPEDNPLPNKQPLVTKIDIKWEDQLMELHFKDDKNSVAPLVLNQLNARRWLAILHSQWLISEWSPKVWPEWFIRAQVEHKPDIH
jgi:hypothetical protein